MNITRALPVVFGLIVVACGGETTPPANSPTSTTGAAAAHDSNAPGAKTSEHKHDHGTLPAPVKAFHDELSPLWHSEKNAERVTKTCAAAGSLKDKAAATADKDLIEATSALAAECSKTGDKPDFEAKFSAVHDKFHAAAKASGGEKH